MKKHRLALVGAGEIAKHYIKGLQNSENLELAAIIDRNPDCAARADFYEIPAFRNVPFFTSCSELYNNALQVDYVLIAASSSAHYDIIMELLEHNVPALLVEKPLAGSLRQVEEILQTAEEKQIPVFCLYHYRATHELRWLKHHLADAPFGKILSITMDIYDNYAADGGKIRADRLPMLGAWLDSGINALSFMDALLPLTERTDDHMKLYTDPTQAGDPLHHALYARREFSCNGVFCQITVDWRHELRKKYFSIQCEKARIDIFHSQQKILIDGEKADGAEWPTTHTLDDQYEILFRNFQPDFAANRALTLRLHQILFSHLPSDTPQSPVI